MIIIMLDVNNRFYQLQQGERSGWVKTGASKRKPVFHAAMKLKGQHVTVSCHNTL
jgi:undecaprenyl pyrophosphate synthase